MDEGTTSVLHSCRVSVRRWSVLEWLQMVISYLAIALICKWNLGTVLWHRIAKTSRKRNNHDRYYKYISHLPCIYRYFRTVYFFSDYFLNTSVRHVSSVSFGRLTKDSKSQKLLFKTRRNPNFLSLLTEDIPLYFVNKWHEQCSQHNFL